MTQEWNNGELHAVPGKVGTGKNNHIAHIDGWTIVVFMDSVDSDWGAIAKPELFYSLQDFVSKVRDDAIGPNGFFRTKEEAFRNIQQQILQA